MPPDYVVFVCFCLVLYLYLTQNDQFTNTASAIRSVFSGDCRMNCQQSHASGFSGISGVQGAGPSQPQGQLTNYRRMSFNCVCETCPCALIENVLSRCSPATRMYTLFTAMLSQIYIHFVQTINAAYEYACNVVECGVSCRKPQIIGTGQFDSSENFSFNELAKRSKEGSIEVTELKANKKFGSSASLRDKLSKTSLASKRSSSNFLRELIRRKKSSDGEEERQADKVETMTDTQSESDSADENIQTAGCPRCIKEGKMCLRECPNTKKRHSSGY